MCLERAPSQLVYVNTENSLQRLKAMDNDLSTAESYPAFEQLGPEPNRFLKIPHFLKCYMQDEKNIFFLFFLFLF